MYKVKSEDVKKYENHMQHNIKKNISDHTDVIKARSCIPYPN